MYIFHFCADFDCSVSVNGAMAGILNAEHDLVSIRVCGVDNFLVSVLPLQSQIVSTLLPYAFSVSTTGHINYDNKLIIATIYPENNIEIKLLPNILNVYEPPEIIKQHTVQSNVLVTVYKDSQYRVMLENSKILLNHTIGKAILDVQIDMLNYENIPYLKIEGVLETSEKYLLLVNMTSYSVAREFTANKIEIDSGVVTVLNNCTDMARHGIVTKYKLHDMQKEIENYTVYTETEVRPINCLALIPYAFFEAILVKNFNLAREYLSGELVQVLDDQHINEFFGAFNEITYNKYTVNNINQVALVYGQQNRHVQIYKISLNNNLIDNIEVV